MNLAQLMVHTRSPSPPPSERPSSRQVTQTGFSSFPVVPPPSPTISRSQSTSSTPSTEPVYQHVRSLKGIIRTITKPPNVATDDDQSIPDLGLATNSYLSAHGYNVGAIYQIEHAFNIHQTSQGFINYLHSRGMPWKEAEYVWGLLQGNLE